LQAQAEAAAAQTRTYLDTALCDGTTTQGRFIMALPLLFKLTLLALILLIPASGIYAFKLVHSRAALPDQVQPMGAMIQRRF